MDSQPTRIPFALTRRQCLLVHAGIWLRHWPGLVLMLAFSAGVVWLAFLKSKWFLLILACGLPPFNNLSGFLMGFIVPLVTGRIRVEFSVEDDRLGIALPGHEPDWVPFDEIVRVDRFGDIWTFLSGGTRRLIAVPAALLDPAVVERIRRTPDKYCLRLEGYVGPDPQPG